MRWSSVRIYLWDHLIPWTAVLLAGMCVLIEYRAMTQFLRTTKTSSPEEGLITREDTPMELLSHFKSQ